MQRLQTATEYAIMAACAIAAYHCGADVWGQLSSAWIGTLDTIAQLGMLAR